LIDDLIAITPQDPEMGLVAPALAIRHATISRLRNTGGSLARRESGGWGLFSRSTLGLADSLAISDLAAAKLGALAVDLPNALLIAELRDVFGCIALPFSGTTIDLLVTVCVTSSTDVTGTILVARLDSLPTVSATNHNRGVPVVALVPSEVTFHRSRTKYCWHYCKQNCCFE
jgi:hypothetical protein